MLIFEIIKTNTPLPQKDLAPILIALPTQTVAYATQATISSVKQSKTSQVTIVTSVPWERERDITENSPLWELLPSNLSWSPIGSRQSNDWPIVAKYAHRMQILTSWEAV